MNALKKLCEALAEAIQAQIDDGQPDGDCYLCITLGVEGTYSRPERYIRARVEKLGAWDADAAQELRNRIKTVERDYGASFGEVVGGDEGRVRWLLEQE